MKTLRPIGVIRPLQPILGCARPRWRGGPMVPMIWRRRLRARSAPPQKSVRPAPFAPTHAFNLTLVWPAGTAARAEPTRRFETKLHRAGETGRLATLVERLWLRPGGDGSSGAAVSSSMNAPAASPGRSSQPAPPAGFVPLARDPRQQRAGAIRQGNGLRAARQATGARVGTGAAAAPRPPAAMMWRGKAVEVERPAAGVSRPSRPRAPLIWKTEPDGGETSAAEPAYSPGRSSATELVWRRPVAGTHQREDGSSDGGPAFAMKDSEIRADRPAAHAPPAPAAAAPAAIQPAEMSRLVDEVVRRLDRIGRDERMRRGI